MDMSDMIEQRAALAMECDTDGAFPGSRAWLRGRDAEKRLEAFDRAHPEVLAKIQADHAQAMAKLYQD